MKRKEIPDVCKIRNKTPAQRLACHRALYGNSNVPERQYKNRRFK